MFGAKPGLERTRQLAAAVGNPQNRLRFIHVAGTNGKGSTCAMLESMYRQAGLRVGLFTSPHLVAFAERIQVNRRLIPEADVVRLVAEIQPHWERLSGEDHPTFFEVVTVMAMRYFAEQQCDLVIWETGLGGRLDATNIVQPLASLITNIQYDHQKWLGNTLAQIAAEKGGIIKPGVPVLTATDATDALSVIRGLARNQRAPLWEITRADAGTGLAATTKLPLLGEHQKLNAALALATVRLLQPSIPVTEAQQKAGLETVHWPGRLQQVLRLNGQTLWLDGAHNLGGVATLCAALIALSPTRKPALILGILRDKDWVDMCRLLAPVAARVLVVQVCSERTASAAELQAVCQSANPAVTISSHPNLSAALRAAETEPFVVIAGSLYLIGEAMELLGLSPTLAVNERGLNEWGGTPIRRETGPLKQEKSMV